MFNLLRNKMQGHNWRGLFSLVVLTLASGARGPGLNSRSSPSTGILLQRLLLLLAAVCEAGPATEVLLPSGGRQQWKQTWKLLNKLISHHLPGTGSGHTFSAFWL